jgi:hypothetical protein
MIYPIEIIKNRINKEYLKKFLDRPFKEVIKFVVDVGREIIAFGGELHSDAQELLIKDGSDARDLWGGTLFLLEDGKKVIIEYSALINIKPSQDSFSMDIKDRKIVEKIEKILKKIIIDL